MTTPQGTGSGDSHDALQSIDDVQKVETLHTIFGTRKPPLYLTSDGTGHRTVATNPRIVIIDDEPINIRVVQRFLSLAGYQQFFTASESTEAMSLIESVHPDVVLLDIMMPNVSGMDILQDLRGDEQFTDLPVIILTAATDRETKLEALRRGATEFLNKPIDSTELEARLRNVLRAKAHQDWIKQYAWELELEVAVRTTELIEAHLEIVECLAKAGEIRDTDTGNHVLRVGCYASIIAKHMGLPCELVERIRLAAPLHDIGKLGIPDAILHKPGRLDEHEIKVMRQHSRFGKELCDHAFDQEECTAISHTVLGARLIDKASSPVLKLAATIAHTHHERWDGSGYPQGLAGEEIPIEGRITAVADVFDALCSRRPYKPPYPVEQALEIVREERASHFDPAVVDAFFRGLEEILAAQRQLPDARPWNLGGGEDPLVLADQPTVLLKDLLAAGTGGEAVPPAGLDHPQATP